MELWAELGEFQDKVNVKSFIINQADIHAAYIKKNSTAYYGLNLLTRVLEDLIDLQDIFIPNI